MAALGKQKSFASYQWDTDWKQICFLLFDINGLHSFTNLSVSMDTGSMFINLLLVNFHG